MVLRFEVETPPSLNNCFVERRDRRGRAKTSEYFKWSQRVRWIIKAGMFRHRMYTEDVAVTILLPRTMRGDIDNRCKPCLDVLRSIAIGDDSQVAVLHVERHEGSQTVIEVRALGEVEATGI